MKEPKSIPIEQVNPQELTVQPEIYKRFEEHERNKGIELALSKLVPKDREVIESRFGFNDYPQTLDEIGNKFKVSTETIRQREMRALRKLRHPENLAIIAEEHKTPEYLLTPQERERKMKIFEEIYSAIQKRVWTNPRQDFRKITDRLYNIINKLFFPVDLEKITISSKKIGKKIVLETSDKKFKFDRHYFVSGSGKVYDPLLSKPIYREAYLLHGFRGFDEGNMSYSTYK